MGRGRGNFLKKGGAPPRFPTPSPNSTPSSSKTFVFIESLLSVFPVGERQGPTDSLWCIGPVVFPVNKKTKGSFLHVGSVSYFPSPYG